MLPRRVPPYPRCWPRCRRTRNWAQLILSVVIGPEYGRVRGRLELAQHRGEIGADADLDLVIDAFIGTALARVTVLDRPLDHAYSARLVNLLLDGVAAR